MGAHPLDNAVRSSLEGSHAGIAERLGTAARYPADVAPFAAVPDDPSPADWADLAALCGPGGDAVLFRPPVAPPGGWAVLDRGVGVQMVADALDPAPDAEAEVLGPEHAAEAMALVARTRPGPFAPRTLELGGYLGFRHGGELVAMAGRRLHPEGHVEISAVCTDEAWRGRGLARRLVTAVAAAIVDEGAVPCLHAAATNTGAVALYERMGFARRRTVEFVRLRAPAG